METRTMPDYPTMSILAYFKQADFRNPLSEIRLNRTSALAAIDNMYDDIRVNELSITFKQKFRDNLSNTQITELLKRYLDWIVDTNPSISEYFLIPEYGENHHLHYHGLIIGKSKELSSLLNCLNARFGRTYIRAIRDQYKYRIYLMKEHQDEEEIPCLHMIRDDYKINLKH